MVTSQVSPVKPRNPEPSTRNVGVASSRSDGRVHRPTRKAVPLDDLEKAEAMDGKGIIAELSKSESSSKESKMEIQDGAQDG